MQQKIKPDLPLHSTRDQWEEWVRSPIGRYQSGWEQEQLDRAVSDLFGFHAVQLGASELAGLRGNRIAHQILVARQGAGLSELQPGAFGSVLSVEAFEDLPFADSSIDLLLLPHVLERATDPHQVIREAARVLRPEGRIIVTGFNPVSLWHAQDIAGRVLGGQGIPGKRTLIGLPRVRDWLRILSFDIEEARYGCYIPRVRRQSWIDRLQFIERIGDRFWPICGAVYVLGAVKRVRAMRLVGPAWNVDRARRGVAIAASPRFHPTPTPPPVRRERNPAG